MKPLKGEIHIDKCGANWESFCWHIVMHGKANIQGYDAYITAKSATAAAKRFAARCGIEITKP